MNIEEKLSQLKGSKFRSKFTLKQKEIDYVNEKGLDVIRNHAVDFVNQKLKVKLDNDGKQTPYKGHPVFITQHATATCCRKCLNKWYGVPIDKTLDDKEINALVNVIMTFIKKSL